MKKIMLTLLAFFMLSFQSVKSEEMYIGIDYLNNEIDTGITNVSSTLDEKDNGYSIYAGLPMNENLDFEVSYNDFGEASLSGNNGDEFILDGTTYAFTTTASIKASATSIGFAAKPKVEVSDGVVLYGKLGVHKWESEFNIVSTDTTTNADDDGTDMFYGAGIEVNLANLKGRIGYSVYDVDDDVDSINVGFSYNF